MSQQQVAKQLKQMETKLSLAKLQEDESIFYKLNHCACGKCPPSQYVSVKDCKEVYLHIKDSKWDVSKVMSA